MEPLLSSFETNRRFGTILMDPPWRFKNRTGKIAPENKKLWRYRTLSLKEIETLPIDKLASPKCHLYLWCPNALLPQGLELMRKWGFEYKTNLVWLKIRRDGGPDGRGVGFYFRNATELLLFGIKGHVRTKKAGRTQVNVIMKQKRDHSRKPEEIYSLIENCSRRPFLELFARRRIAGWKQWGDELGSPFDPRSPTHVGL
jgi:N6-adenosine-specific RNA methylase IME4